MGSLGIVTGEGTLILEPCRFPTSPKKTDVPDVLGQIDIFKTGDPLKDVERALNPSDNLLRTAWAILLHSYVRNDSVSFALLSAHQTHTPSSITGSGQLLIEIVEPLLCQYQDPEALKTHSTLPEVCQPLSPQELDQLQINTAIFSSSSRSWKSGQQGHGSLSTVPYFQHKGVEYLFDLILSVNPKDWAQDLSISYRCSKISRSFAESVAATFRHILKELAFSGNKKVNPLDVISEEDKQKMLFWNPKKPYSRVDCVHYIIERVAQSLPSSEAVCAWDGSLTYSELDLLTSIVARRLIRAGVRVGDFVAFALEKSFWSVVATLAILRAGGALVPLDPTHPVVRLEEILKDTHTTIVVTSEPFEPLFAELGKQVVIVSSKKVQAHQLSEDIDIPLPVVSPQDPVFILFTSGSTGKPKGMILEHGAICTHAITHGEAMRYQGARVLQFSAHTFDVAFIDIFTTLIFGGCVCVPSEEDRVNDISRVIRNTKVDLAVLTPSFASLIDPKEVPDLKTLCVGGEAVSQEFIQRWADKVCLIEIYGPAEVGICMTIDVENKDSRPETVGFALANSSCWLVDPDDHNRLVPVGAAGELLVAGPSLARGYVGNEATTRASFITNPRWASEMGLRGWRFYKTGDILRHNIDNFNGSYDFVRRKDTQIKLHGQRIELGEVEHHLANIPDVAVSMVAHPKEGCLAGELVAVVQMGSLSSTQISNEPISLDSHQSLSLDTIRRHLSKHLPVYMIPTACFAITRMPFNLSCKINRRVIDSWLASIETRLVEESATTTLANFESWTLARNEITANAISTKVAELVAHRDKSQAPRLQGRDFVLQNAGLDSIRIVSLSMFLRKEYGVKISLNRLLSPNTTIRGLASLVNQQDSQPPPAPGTSDGIDFDEEQQKLSSALLQSIGFKNSNIDLTRCSVRNVFITGATGYLGLGILQNLMNRSKVQVFALVRCKTESEGLKRIAEGAQRMGWWKESFAARIQVWSGDLTKPHLGLSEEKIQLLGGTAPGDVHIQSIIHNGAKVHYNLDYEALKPSNVHPTVELLKVTASAKNISTFVYVSGGRRPTILEEDASVSIDRAGHTNGYGQSKLVSESVVKDCFGHPCFQGKRLRVIRPGYIIGSLDRGLANQTDFIWRLIAGCLETKSYSRDEEQEWLFISDVERAAELVAARAFDPLPTSDVSQVLDGLPFHELWSLLKDDFGYELQPVPHGEWLKGLERAIMYQQESHMLFPFIDTLLDKEGGRGGWSIGSKEIPSDCDSTRAREAVRRNVLHLINVGFLPTPPPNMLLPN